MDFEKKSHTMDFEKGESHGMVNSGVGAAFQEVSFINKVFGLMTLGLLVTAFVAGYMATHVTPQLSRRCGCLWSLRSLCWCWCCLLWR